MIRSATRRRAGAAATTMLAVVTVASCGVAGPPPSPTPPPTPTPMPEPSSLRYTVEGQLYALSCMGPVDASGPVVVLVPGLGVPVRTWQATQVALLDEPVRTCAVDRPISYGVGPGEERRTVAVWNRELRGMLEQAGIDGPVVLVGHSLGGLAVELYARDHPGEVAGLVFVDAIRPGFDARLEALLVPSAASARRRDLELNEEGIRYEDLLASDAEVAAAGPLPAVPAVVITHGEPFGEESSAWPGAAVESLWSALQEELVAELPRSRLVVAEDSGHRIQERRPDLVADAVREVRAAALAEP